MSSLFESTLNPIEAERAVIGGMMVDADYVLGELRAHNFDPVDFSRPHHEALYRAILDLSEQVRPDTTEVILHVLKLDLAEECGGSAVISSITDNIPSTTNVGHYIREGHDAAARRRTKAKALRLAEDAGNPTKDLDAVLATVTEQLRGIVGSSTTSEEETGADLANAVLFALNNPVAQLPQWSTGIPELDAVLGGGLSPTRLYIIGGRPKHGKSTLGLNIACAFCNRGDRVHIDSLEMSSTLDEVESDTGKSGRPPGDLASKLVAMQSGVRQRRNLRDYRQDEYECVHRAAFEMAAWPLTVDAKPSRHYNAIFAAARRRKAKHPDFRLLVIDYIGLIKGNAQMSRREVFGEISRGLKSLAKELEICVVLLAQINRGPETRTDQKPTAADLKESGDLEQDADAIIVLQNPHVAKLHPVNDRIWIRVDLHRHFPPGEVVMQFSGPTGRIYGPTVADPTKMAPTGKRRRQPNTDWD